MKTGLSSDSPDDSGAAAALPSDSRQENASTPTASTASAPLPDSAASASVSTTANGKINLHAWQRTLACA